MINHVSFCSEASAAQRPPSSDTALISITNPGDIAPLKDGWAAVLRIAFADASYTEKTIESYRRMWHLSSYGFPTKKHALAIRGFLDALPPSATTLLIHCGAGVSRSAAVAKYASARYGLNFEKDYDRYNEALFRLLENPETFDRVLERFPAKRPSFLSRTWTACLQPFKTHR